ncbi:MAG: hypothetical protein GC171_11585 [Terrimonas sp.]|nr:hypothetical protein [Terrimonas sp.]
MKKACHFQRFHFLSIITILFISPVLVKAQQPRINLQVRPDMTYGTGGKLYNFKYHNFDMYLTVDPAGITRESKRDIMYSNGYQKEIIHYYNSGGDKVHYKADIFKDAAEILFQVEGDYADNKFTRVMAYGYNTEQLAETAKDPAEKKYYQLDRTAGSLKAVPGLDYKFGAYTPDLSVKTRSATATKIDYPYAKLDVGGSVKEQVPDRTYGLGKKVIKAVKFGLYGMEDYDIVDENGVVRLSVYREYYPDGYIYEEKVYFDCFGKRLHYSEELYDDWDDYSVSLTEVHYEDGEPVSGFSDWETEYGEDMYEVFDPITQSFVSPFSFLGNLASLNNIRQFLANTDPCHQKIRQQRIFVGPGLIKEDTGGSNGFSLLGLQGQYNRLLTGRIALTGDIGFYAKSENGQKQSKITTLAGITFYPIPGAGFNNNVSFSVHGLAGMSFYAYKFMGYKNSDSYFTADAGIGLDYDFKNTGLIRGVGLRAGYLPTFGDGNTANNLRVGIGVGF